nr:MAG TPA: hypothetical protein [Caudoviricetes sp.]
MRIHSYFYLHLFQITHFMENILKKVLHNSKQCLIFVSKKMNK